MFTRIWKLRLLFTCLVVSIMVHVLFARALSLFGTYEFNPPVNAPAGLVVDLASPRPAVSAVVPRVATADDRAEPLKPATPFVKSAVAAPAAERSVPVSPAALRCEPESKALPLLEPATLNSAAAPVAGGVSQAAHGAKALPPLRTGGAFLAAQYEKLTYQLMMFEIPVGTAELEAKSENGATSITLRIRSNIAMSSIYPVDDLVEVHHVGSFIMAKVRQREGAFRSDELFTINPGKKRVTWFDNINGRSLQTAVPTEEVLDTLSAIYYFRNRELTVGRTETLHIFDSEIYAAVPVEILAREELRLPNLTKINTLVVRPLQQTAGIFRRTGDVLIWISDDSNKVPVKIVTSIPLGKVTAELIAAETKPYAEEPDGQPRQQTGLTSVDGRREVH